MTTIDIRNRFTPEQRENIINKAAEALAAPEDQPFFRVTLQMIAEERGDLALCHIIEAALKRANNN